MSIGVVTGIGGPTILRSVPLRGPPEPAGAVRNPSREAARGVAVPRRRPLPGDGVCQVEGRPRRSPDPPAAGAPFLERVAAFPDGFEDRSAADGAAGGGVGSPPNIGRPGGVGRVLSSGAAGTAPAACSPFERETAPRYHEPPEAFQGRTDCAFVVNTSFNKTERDALFPRKYADSFEPD